MSKKNIDKSPVKLRKKKISSGNHSLYLDIYDRGSRRREYLKLYLIPEHTPKSKEQNRKTLELAETIRSERLLSLQANKSTFFSVNNDKPKISFADYIASEIERVKTVRTKNYVRRYKCGEMWVRKYDDKTSLEDIDVKWVKGFIGFLSSTPGTHGRILNQNTIHEYLIYVANILNNAVREGLIPNNPTKKLTASERPKKYDSKREYLTEEELRRLMAVPSPQKYHHIRGAFLFACFCGLRYSDLLQLKWKHIKQVKDGLVVEKKMQKTKSMLYLPLNKKATSLLPLRKNGNELVFDLPNSMTTTESYIKVWSEFAMIDKHVTFHTSRHTFAVNILACGGDVFTLSKLLGHKKVTTTQIYADVRDEAKIKTMELLDKL